MAVPPLVVAGASRPYPGEQANGDAWRVDWHDGRCRIAVVDGLGHGPQAAAAAQAALAALAAQPELAPAAALQACHRALRGTRGAVVGIASIAPATGALCYAGVGNIEARVWWAEREQRLLSYRGVVGSHLPTVRTVALQLHGAWVLVLHSDGVSARAPHTELAAVLAEAGDAAAEAMVARWGRTTDDATVVVVHP